MAPDPAAWPSVAAVVPARNEADVIGASIASLLTQDYPEPLAVILTDDQSDDGTAEAARAAARAAGAADRLTILPGKPLPPGWTGKLWAQKQGRGAGKVAAEPPRYLLLTDADIAYDQRRGAPPRRACRGAGAGADLAHGQAALRKPRRTRADPRLRVLFPDALPLRVGEPERERHGRGGGRLHARPGRCAGSCWRHRGDPRLAHRRLRAWPRA